MNTSQAQELVFGIWDASIVPKLCDYIRIPSKSPLFDPEWKEHGHMDRAVALIEGWCREQPIEGLTVEVIQLEGRTPLIYMEVSRRQGRHRPPVRAPGQTAGDGGLGGRPRPMDASDP